MKIDCFEFVVLALAAWRLATMLVEESGPGAIFSRIRRRAGLSSVVQMGPDGTPVIARVAKGWIAELLSCVWCTSVWTAGGLVIADCGLRIVNWETGLAVFGVIAGILAVSAGAILVHEIVGRLRGES